jgi:type II secretory ATPase GspE/PulE/Tfp pilus assembly ATPase PilB-like protein
MAYIESDSIGALSNAMVGMSYGKNAIGRFYRGDGFGAFAANAKILHDFFKSNDADQDAHSLFNAILRSAIRQGVSHIHINPSSDGRFRVAGRRDDSLYYFGDPQPYHRGPKASRKTISLYSLLAVLNNGWRSILPLEDSVEYRLEGIAQNVGLCEDATIGRSHT